MDVNVILVNRTKIGIKYVFIGGIPVLVLPAAGQGLWDWITDCTWSWTTWGLSRSEAETLGVPRIGQIGQITLPKMNQGAKWRCAGWHNRLTGAGRGGCDHHFNWSCCRNIRHEESLHAWMKGLDSVRDALDLRQLQPLRRKEGYELQMWHYAHTCIQCTADDMSGSQEFVTL